MEDKEAATDIDMDVPIATVFNRRKKLKTKRKEQPEQKAIPDGVAAEGFIPPNQNNNINEGELPPGITVSEFDYSVQNHFKAVDTISRLCGETDQQGFDPAEIRRLSSSITFIREWRQFSYPSKTLRFVNQSLSGGKDFVGAVTLPQFSSAAVPKRSDEKADATFLDSSNDFVMNVGGLVSALDWCPRVRSHSNCNIRSEFIAVAAHPPESSYHKLGVPVVGRGMLQVWCVLSLNMEKVMQAQNKKKRKQRSSVMEAASLEPPKQKGPRGRPRKCPVDVNVEKKPRGRPRKTPSSESQAVESLAVPLSIDSSTLPSVDKDSSISNTHLSKKNSTKLRKVNDKVPLNKSRSTACRKSKVKARTGIQNPESAPCQSSLLENVESSILDSPSVVSPPDTVRCDPSPNKCSIPNDVALPRMVLCLAHNGKVAWDVKWRPSGVSDKQRMGYLAVLLGNGALEVWEIPFPQTVKVLFSDSQGETTDPRFMKLQPVFRCSRIMFGDRQSIPLALEWSASFPHDMILAGCHDGVVALWKFCSTTMLQENKPLLCFSADTVPIRALSWAPAGSSSESSNIVVTAGHKGLKFWDLCDPFRPLWELNPIQRIIYSLDWVPDPRYSTAGCSQLLLFAISIMECSYLPINRHGCLLWCRWCCSSFPAYYQGRGKGSSAKSSTTFSLWNVSCGRFGTNYVHFLA
ncbi:OLC1v1034269C4 [Oldenlandia corymbosa var. corymbosa]|uniref:OLC1v1034269C4 n=1 Tax=Oldenlandia corymbosa var. corymbosa TaxID=529605 RepID=A0AAV1CQC6_OLDCO|nr:OLC1v1034269C4 [Oldenlandia corymbosa var. corymbosa]